MTKCVGLNVCGIHLDIVFTASEVKLTATWFRTVNGKLNGATNLRAKCGFSGDTCLASCTWSSFSSFYDVDARTSHYCDDHIRLGV
uniref:Uncharacterized protein n=1 Tax=Peronospora matthiolae TaxID=2874970 RepID=A0AAV1TJW2_9STRA